MGIIKFVVVGCFFFSTTLSKTIYIFECFCLLLIYIHFAIKLVQNSLLMLSCPCFFLLLFCSRLSIFGFTTRQQFEEYFMTFLLLINKVYDENMVDQQEQFQIRSICLEAIMELLITYKTFPIVGNKLSLYHHTTRWNRINCDAIR